MMAAAASAVIPADAADLGGSYCDQRRGTAAGATWIN